MEELDLNHMNLQSLQGLQSLVNLRRASFYDNQVSFALDMIISFVGLRFQYADYSHTKNFFKKSIHFFFFSSLLKQITKIEGLENCRKLEELCLEENYISKIEGLSSLSQLKKLELGRNKITLLENLQELVFLTQLCVPL